MRKDLAAPPPRPPPQGPSLPQSANSLQKKKEKSPCLERSWGASLPCLCPLCHPGAQANTAPPDARRGTLTRPRESMRSALTRRLTPPRLPVRTRVPFCTRADSCPYAVLDLPNDATEEQVQAAYRSLAKRCSPMPRMPSTPTPMTHARERSAPWQVAPRHAVGVRGPLSGDPVSSR